MHSERIYKDSITTSSKVKRMFWQLCYFLFFRFTPEFTLHGWRVLLLKAFGAKIGKGCKIAPDCRIWVPWNLEIGSFVCFAGGSEIYNVDKVIVGHHVTVSQDAYICTASHDITSVARPLTHAQIILQQYSWVCARVFVGPGVTIHEGAVAAACAVVTKDVEAWSVAGGNPAKFIKKRIVHDYEQSSHG